MRIPHFSGDVDLCRLKKTDIIMITTSRFFKEKQYMWYKVRELQSKGLNKTQIGKHLEWTEAPCGDICRCPGRILQGGGIPIANTR